MNDAQDIKRHVFFGNINWVDLDNKAVSLVYVLIHFMVVSTNPAS